MRRIFLGISLLVGALLAVRPVEAHPRAPSAPYSVVVVDEGGRELRTFHHGGETFVLGEYGTRYNIRVENRTGRRVEAVITVDGRDVVSGKVGDFVNERGYLIEPYGQVVIEGFRQSLSQVAAFRFTSPSNSYSSRMGTPQNVGVIGVAFFPERTYRTARPAPVPYSRREYRDGAKNDSYGRSKSRRRPAPRTAPPAPAQERSASGSAEAEAPAAARSRGGSSYDYDDSPEPSTQNLGTEYGESRQSYVTETEFRRENHYSPAQIVTLRYDDRDGLTARGIRLWTPRRRVVQSNPQAFPNNRFAPPPPY